MVVKPFEDWLAKKFVVPMIRKTVFCSIVDSPPAIFTDSRAQKNAMDQKAILEKCLTPGHVIKILSRN